MTLATKNFTTPPNLTFAPSAILESPRLPKAANPSLSDTIPPSVSEAETSQDHTGTTSAGPSPPPNPTATTASSSPSQKKRRLFPTNNNPRPHPGYASESDSPSPRLEQSSVSVSPVPSFLQGGGLKGGHQEFGKEEDSSPSGRLVELDIASETESGGASFDMAEQQQSEAREGLRRSHSPAKRTADDMEEIENAAGVDAMDTQETGAGNGESAPNGSIDVDEKPPAYSERDHAGEPTQQQIDEQIRKVTEVAMQEPDAGSRGYLISAKWLSRVYSRSTDGKGNSEYPKEAREGNIGPIDNSDIAVEGSFTDSLRDIHDHPFIPLRPGLTTSQDFEIMSKQAWDLIIGWYHLAEGQEPIARYARNTADPPAVNILYEIYPPVFTVRKVPQPGNPRSLSPRDSATALRLKQERKGRGQSTPDDAARFVSSRTERFQTFLKRSKEAASIPRGTKVKIWKLLDPANVGDDNPVDNTSDYTTSPPKSRASSPKPDTTSTKLVVEQPAFRKMEVGVDLEFVDAKDETMNEKYNGTSSMDMFGLFEDTTLVLEEQLGGPGGGEFQSDSKKVAPPKKVQSQPASTTASGRTSPAPGGVMTRGRARKDGRTKGTIGLTNLGNTCYMNSALQCIRSVEELALYFLAGKYKEEINANNVLGHGGTMAKAYAGVLEGIYSEKSLGAFAPRNFKAALGHCAPLFSGYGQQDSQEFLSFLVDALHEDLNRIMKKPYIENPESDDKTVHDPQAIVELGDQYRDIHSKRNSSIAMDLFNGFYKNTMDCSHCDKTSVTFDPFSLLTVQLPIEHTFLHPIAFVPMLGRPVQHQLDIDRSATIKQVKAQIGAKHGISDPDRLWMVEVYSRKIYKTFDDDKATIAEANIQHNDHIYIFELEAAPTNVTRQGKPSFYGRSKEQLIPDMDDQAADRMVVSVFSRSPSRYERQEAALHPVQIVVSREEAQDYNRILKKILVATVQLSNREILLEEDQASRKTSTFADTATDGEQTSSEESARVSDHSVPSEDGMVDVSVNREGQGDSNNGVPASHDATAPVNPVPEGFWNDDYFVPPGLQGMFTMNYATNLEQRWQPNGMDSFDKNSVRDMSQRVQRAPERRNSLDSSSSSLKDSGSSGSRQETAETEESDVDEETPSLTTGDSPNSLANSDDDSELPEVKTLMQPSVVDNDARGGRKKNGKKDKFQKSKKGKKQTYGKQRGHKFGNTLNSNKAPLRNAQSSRTLTGQVVPSKLQQETEGSYYIKLGECIVLDWSTDAMNAVFGDGVWRSAPEPKNLPKVSDPELEAKQNKRAARKKNGIDLEECFQTTSKPEILTEDNTWYCNRCKEQRRATKTLEIWTIPDILVVHLKRFGGNRSIRDKIDVFVDYPVEGLDMTERIGCKEDGKEYLYDLFAVDNHYGGLGVGHYTAVAKNFYDGHWYDYNDGSCSKTSAIKVHSPAAYLLFYRRRSDKPLGPKYLQDIVEESRNPPPAEPAVEATDELASKDVNDESDSGEARLGDPASSSRQARGSSSVSLHGAGAAAGNHTQLGAALPRADGAGGTSAAAGRGVRIAAGTGQTGREAENAEQEDEGFGEGEDGGGFANHFPSGGASWGFENIDEAAAAGQDDDDDAASTTATFAEDRSNDERFSDWQGGSRGYANTPTSNFNDFDDRDDGGERMMFDDDDEVGTSNRDEDTQAVDIHLGDGDEYGGGERRGTGRVDAAGQEAD
ncbi:hypothetical protein MBLNU230_g8084t1 [Neophaeotheca triangularis]